MISQTRNNLIRVTRARFLNHTRSHKCENDSIDDEIDETNIDFDEFDEINDLIDE